MNSDYLLNSNLILSHLNANNVVDNNQNQPQLF